MDNRIAIGVVVAVLIMVASSGCDHGLQPAATTMTTTTTTADRCLEAVASAQEVGVRMVADLDRFEADIRAGRWPLLQGAYDLVAAGVDPDVVTRTALGVGAACGDPVPPYAADAVGRLYGAAMRRSLLEATYCGAPALSDYLRCSP